MSNVVPENMVHGSPEKRKELVLHATQWSTADYPAVHNQTQPQKQSAVAPAVMGDEGEMTTEDDARSEKTKKSSKAAQNQYQLKPAMMKHLLVTFFTHWSRWTALQTGPRQHQLKQRNHNQGCHGHHHSRAMTTPAQHSGGPCSSTSQNLGSTRVLEGNAPSASEWSTALGVEFWAQHPPHTNPARIHPSRGLLIHGIWGLQPCRPRRSTRQNSVANSHAEVESQGHSHAMGETHAQGGGQIHTQGGGQTHGGENPFGGGQAHDGGQVLGGEIPVGGPQQMALMFEMIKGMQQNQAELAESLRQMREANGNKEDHQNKNDNRNHEERESHNKNDTPFVTMSDEPYPEKYDTPVFALFDGRKGSAMEHISKFLDSMGPFAAHGDLCLREFSKSLVDRAYTWYTVLPAGSIRTWEDMVESFCSKYFHVEEKITLVNLHSTKQQIGEDLVKYIHRFRDVSLDCHVKYQEGELVEVCIDNMLPEFRAHLENLDITRFAPLLQKARKTAISVKPQVEKSRDKKSLPQTLTVSTTTAPSGTKRKSPSDKAYEEPPPLPFTAEEMMAIFDKYVNHPTVDCRTLRWEVNRKIQDGTLQLSEAQQKVHQTPFPNYNKDKGKAVVSVVIHGNVSDMEAEESAAASSSLVPAANQEPLVLRQKLMLAVLFLETTNAITFTDEDMEVQYPDHRRPLYLSAVVKDVQVRRALVDTGSCLNLIPLSTLQAANVPQQKIQGSPMEVGPIVALTRFHVVNAETPYHVLLGRPWLHKHKLVSSTYHQCVKGRLNGKPIRIAANSCPFDQTEAHFVEAALYDDLASTGEPSIVRPCGTPLPAWEDIKDDPEIDLRELLERKKKRKEREVEHGSPPQCVRVQLPDGRIVYPLMKVTVDHAQSTVMNHQKVAVDQIESMAINFERPAVDQIESMAVDSERPVVDQEESTAMDPGGSTVDHASSTVRNSGAEAVADQTESTTMSKEKSTTAEPNITSKEELEVINLSDDPDITKPISISKSLSAKERKCLIDLLHEYKDVFAWDYHEMPGIDPGLVAHSLNVEPGTRPVVQPMRTFHTEVEAQITQEVKKLLAAGFIKPIQHPRWLSNIVPVKKKNGQIRCCVDFRNLNKACPKDEFPLPNMDLLIDSAAGHAMFSFMDGFSGYNQIRMSTRDAEKTAFRTPIGNFYYTVMPFGLKNAGATYQRTMTAMFHDMMHKEIEDYVDDIVVKSKKREDHLRVLRKVFDRCRLYKLKMNPLKCAFGVSAGKFLGFLVHNRGIDVDPAKASAIATMKAPTSHKELKSFLGRLSYIRRFIPGLAAATAIFMPLMKKGVPFVWSTACQQAFEKIQLIMTKLPTVCAPVPWQTTAVYTWLPIMKQLGAWWLQEDEEGTEKPIYYVSRALKDAETRYSGAERACFSLEYMHHSVCGITFLAHKIQLITKSHPIRSLLHRPVLSGRLAQWLLQLSQYEITTETPTAIKSQAIADLLAQFPGEDSSSISHEVPGEIGEALLADLADSTWTLKFDGSSTSSSSGAGIVLTREDGETIAKSFKLDFSCSNNASEYEAYITGLVIAHEMGIKHLRVIGDSNLIICQTKGEFSLKEPSLALYRALAQKLEEKFHTFEISHAMRCENRYADALATLGSQVSFEGSKVDITIDKRSMPITDLLKEKFKEQNLDAEDWRTPIRAKLMSPEGVADLKVLKDYVLIAGDLYRRLPGGVLARCVSLQEAAKKLTEVHERCCELRDGHESDQVYATFVSSDWRTPFLEYLIENVLPQTSQAATRLKKLATRYFVEGGILFRKGFHGDPLRCLSLAESQIRDERSPFRRVWRASRQEKIVSANMATPWPFHTWGLDLIGPINPSSGGCIWILVATEYFTKWVEAIPLRKATGAAVANFIREHIITRVADLEGLEEARELAQARSLRYHQKLADAYEKTLQTRIFAKGQMVLKTVDHVRRGLPSPSKFAPNWEGPYLIREAYDSGYYKLSTADGTTLVDPINGKVAEALLTS
uniref:RNA-directed DNA polymerase n=1 Tax=Fagus sylvatica TaxID=28930 RepID=A0A2N9FCJ7_FAGSY